MKLLCHRRTILYLLGLLVIARVSHCQEEVSLQFCYDSNDVAQRCEPSVDTFSFKKVPTLTPIDSTCGNPPEDFCMLTYIDEDTISKMCGFVCDSSSPENSHEPEKMTDFSDGTTWWQSRSGIQNISIQIDLGTEVQVKSILITFKSIIPDAFYILRSTDNGNSFEPYNYFASDCMKYGINPNVELVAETETQILCQTLDDPTPDVVTFVPILNRPSANDSTPGFSKSLYSFMTLTSVQVVLNGHRQFDSLNESDYYYAIEDLSVVGSCHCNGHASTCNEVSGEYICKCEHNTAGSRCERCKDLFNDLEWDIAIGNPAFECKSKNYSSRM